MVWVRWLLHWKKKATQNRVVSERVNHFNHRSSALNVYLNLTHNGFLFRSNATAACKYAHKTSRAIQAGGFTGNEAKRKTRLHEAGFDCRPVVQLIEASFDRFNIHCWNSCRNFCQNGRRLLGRVSQSAIISPQSTSIDHKLHTTCFISSVNFFLSVQSILTFRHTNTPREKFNYRLLSCFW